MDLRNHKTSQKYYCERCYWEYKKQTEEFYEERYRKLFEELWRSGRPENEWEMNLVKSRYEEACKYYQEKVKKDGGKKVPDSDEVADNDEFK